MFILFGNELFIGIVKFNELTVDVMLGSITIAVVMVVVTVVYTYSPTY